MPIYQYPPLPIKIGIHLHECESGLSLGRSPLLVQLVGASDIVGELFLKLWGDSRGQLPVEGRVFGLQPQQRVMGEQALVDLL
jgi:hypothetical protein